MVDPDPVCMKEDRHRYSKRVTTFWRKVTLLHKNAVNAFLTGWRGERNEKAKSVTWTKKINGSIYGDCHFLTEEDHLYNKFLSFF